MSHIVLRSSLYRSLEGFHRIACSRPVVLGLGIVVFASGCSLTPVEQAAAPIVGGEGRATAGSMARPGQADSSVPSASVSQASAASEPNQAATDKPDIGTRMDEGRAIGGVAEPVRPVIDPNRQASLGRSIGQFQTLRFEQLEGWQNDPLDAALLAWRRNCEAMVLKGQPFIRLCEESQGIDAQDSNAVRGFFERHFEPRRLVTAGPSGRNQNTITGYYEPVLKGSRTATTFIVFLCIKPPPIWSR